MAHDHRHEVQPLKARYFEMTNKCRAMYALLMLAGGVTFLLGLQYPQKLWPAFLVSFFYFVSLSLGGLFFTSIQHVSKAGWSATVRRIPESFSAFLPIGLLAMLVLLYGSKYLYPWLDTETLAADHNLQKKLGYLNLNFFSLRTLFFFGLWMLFGYKMVKNSLNQDKTGDENLSEKNLTLSIFFLILFALSYSLFSVDVLMSLDPHWFSTIFGVYCFSGLFQSVLAMTLIFTVKFMRNGLLKGLVNENHLHDLGKFLFAFTVFYAYIGFSQFMIIWYANLPEETIFYLHRAHGNWMPISLSLLIFKFMVPFFALLPRGAKRDPIHLVLVSVLILVMQYVDLYWLIYPNFNEGHVVFSFWEVGMFLGFLGTFLFVVHRFLAKNSVVALKDPRLEEALHHHI